MQITISQSTVLADFLLIVALLLIITAVPIVRRFLSRKRKLRLSGSSVLLSYHTDDTKLIPIGHGKVGKMHYSAMAIIDKGITFYQIELPFSTNIHLVNMVKRDFLTELSPAGVNAMLEPVVLEGNYSDMFTMYCEKNQQQQARYVMDPQAMAFTLDFCTSHNWEIIDNSLYFMQTGERAEGDPTSMLDDITRFVDEIRPKINQPLTDAERNAVAPYSHDRRNGLLCPVCSTELTNHDTYYSCPSGHGFLMTGGMLAGLHKNEVNIQHHAYDTNAVVDEDKEMMCPSCGEVMRQVAYNGDKTTIINSCSNCPYRWIDGGDISGIQK